MQINEINVKISELSRKSGAENCRGDSQILPKDSCSTEYTQLSRNLQLLCKSKE